MAVYLRNLIPDPSMEKGGWSIAASSERGYAGNTSMKITGTASTPEVTPATTAAIALNNTHIYYARMYGYQVTKSGGSVGFYWPIAEPNFREGIALGAAGQWNMYSARNNRTSFSNGNYQFRVDYNNNYQAGTIYIDGVMLIDLTAAFGAGNEPSQAWCDEHIPYFETGKTILDDTDYARIRKLPARYYGVEYIRSSGGAYIDTGFMHNQNTRVTMQVKPSALSANGWLFEGRISTSGARKGVFFYYSSTKKWTSDYPSSRKNFTVNETDFLNIDYNKNVCTINGETQTHTAKTFQSTANLVLMARNQAGTVNSYAKGYLYSAQVYDNGTLIRDFCPCYDIRTGAIGMFDVVNHVFYAGQGSNGFTMGKEVVFEPDPVAVPDIASAYVTPQQVNMNTQVTIFAAVSEVYRIPEPELIYSGEIYSNEVIL